MFWKSLSIRWRMVLILVVLPLLLLLPGFLFVGAQYRNAYRDARLGKGEIIARQVEQTLLSVSPYISSVRDLPDLDQYLNQSIEGQPEMAFAAVVLGDGLAVYHSVPGLSGMLDPVLEDLDSDARFQQAIVPYTGFREVYLVSREIPLDVEGGESLYIVIGEYADLVDPPFLTWAPVLAGIAVAVLLVILLQATLSRLILSPLEEVAEGAALIGAGDLLYRIKVTGTDEIAFLGRRFNEMARQVHNLVTTLEQQVAERTEALEERNEHLEAVARVTREAVRVRSVPLLLETTVNAVSEHFDYYHTGIFLTDDEQEWAVLAAASSEGGKRMLARRHRLRVGEQGIVGTVTATGEPRIALDVGQDAVWFDTPELPETRSEIALPLIDADGEVVGALDVQSAQPGAFGPEDIETLQLLADQVSVAYQNARLLERTQSALAELSTLQQEQSRRGWARVISRMRPRAYEYDRISVNPVLPLPVPDDGGDGDAAQMVMDGSEPVVMEPMRYRGETVGYVSLSDPQRAWTEDELELIRSVSDQIAIALENARLFEDAQRTARSQALLNYVLNTASSRTQSTEEALHEITFILAQALDMAVGIFTFPESDTGVVRLQALILPDGEEVLSPGAHYDLPTDLQLFFKGLENPELGKLLPFMAEADLGDTYEQERVLYVPIRTAAAQIGFMAMVQRQGDLLLDPETRSLARSLAQQIGVVVENLRLLEETQRRSAELQALYEVSLQFGEELDISVMHRLIVEQATNLFDAESCGFFLYNEHEEALELSEVIGSLGRYSDLSLSPGEGLSGVVFQRGEPVRVDDYARWSGRVSDIERQEFGPALGVPLLVADEIRGVLYVAREPGRPAFDDSDIRLAELFAAQASVALENARLYQESAQRARDLQELYEAGLDLVSRLQMEEVLEAGADWARRVLDGARAFVFYWDEEAGRYRDGRSIGEAERAEGVDISDYAAPREDGVTQLIRESGEIVLIDDAQTDSRASPSLRASGMRSQIGGPLRFGRQVMGAIFVHSPEVGHFEQEDGQLLEFLGSQIATAMENSQLFGRTQSALGVVADQARAQTSVAQATAMLTERGTQSLNQVVRLLGEAADVDLCLYFDAREDSQGLYWMVEATWNRRGTEPPEITTIRRDMVPHWFVDLQEGLVLDALSDAQPEERALMEARDIKSVLGLPVRGEAGEIPGFLGFIDRREEREWREEQITPLQTVAAALASTLARERLFQQVQEALSETELLYEAGSALNVATSYDDILNVMRQRTIVGQNAAHVSIQLYNRPWTEEQLPEWAEVVARWTTLPESQLFKRYRQDSFPSLIQVISRDTLTIIRDMEDDPRVGERLRAFFFRRMGAQSAIFVPLVVGGESIGFLAGLYPERMSFSGSEVRRLLNLATQAAVAIQNRYQIQATAARARREQMIREIAGQIQAAPDVQGVLETATRELGRVLRSPHTVVHLGGLSERRRRKLGTGPLAEEGGGDGDGSSGEGQE